MLSIRPAVAADAETLAPFAARAFTDAYREIDDPDDLARYVAHHFRTEVVAAQLADPSSTVLLAYEAAQLVGYAQVRLSAPPPCVTEPAPVELARLYLSSAATGRGIGRQVLQAAFAEARRLARRTMWLGVYDRNVRAVRFYTRAGFVAVGERPVDFAGKPYFDPVMVMPVPPGG